MKNEKMIMVDLTKEKIDIMPMREDLTRNYIGGEGMGRPALGVMSTVISGLQAAKTILDREGINEPLSDIGIKRGVMTG